MAKLNDFLQFDTEHGGEAVKIWPKLLAMAFPEIASKPLTIQLSVLCRYAIAKMDLGAAELFQVIEYCAGYGNLSRSFLRRKCRVASLDQKYMAEHDALTALGLRMWIMCMLTSARNAFLWFAPECGSFVSLSISQNCRCEGNRWMGDWGKAFVHKGNSLMIVCSMIMAIAASLGHGIGLEQPSSSAMFRTFWMAHIIEFFKLERTLTYLGAFGGRTCKPLVLLCSYKLDAMIRDKPVLNEALATRGEGENSHSYTGKKDLLSDSEVYTVSFAETLAKIVTGQA